MQKTYKMPLGLLVAAAAFLVYANSLFNGFALDDHAVILNNPVLKGNVLSVFSVIDTVSESQLLPLYRPFTYLTFLMEGRLHNFNPFLIRLFNVLLHSANAYLVYRLARSIFKENIYAPLLVGLLFAVHPIQSEGVDFNAGGRNTMLACFFSLAAYLFHHRSIGSQRISSAFAGALMFLLGLFSKEIGLMILPFILFLETQTILGKKNRQGWGQATMRLAPYLVATAIYLVMRWLTLSKLGLQSGILPGVGSKVIESMYVTTDLPTRLFHNIYIIPHYLMTLIWPVSLANRYVIPDDFNLLALPLFVAWVAVIGGTSWLLTRGRSSATLLGLSWLVIFWLPVSGIVLVPGAPLADRFFYVPAIGFWIIVGDQTSKILIPYKNLTRHLLAGVAVILLILAALTVRRNLDWRNNMTLYTRFVEQYPDNVHARAGLGVAYYGDTNGKTSKLAEREFETVVSMDPNFPMIYTYLGNIKLNREDISGALYAYDRALEVYPYDKEALVNRGIVKEKLGKKKEALADYLMFMAAPGGSDHLPGGRQHAEARIRALSQ